MNCQDEEKRISKLDIGDVKLELSTIEWNKDGGNSFDNLRRLLLELRRDVLNAGM